MTRSNNIGPADERTDLFTTRAMPARPGATRGGRVHPLLASNPDNDQSMGIQAKALADQQEAAAFAARKARRQLS